MCGAAVLVITACVAWLGAAAAPGETVLAVSGRSNATPSIAAAGAFVAVTWTAGSEGGRADVYLAASGNAGRTFDRPVRVSGTAGADVSGEQPPRVVLGERPGRAPAIIVVWTSKGASGTRLLSARSDDGGRRFSPPAPIPGSDAAGNRGWESVAMTPDGDAVALWLDHRELATGATANGMHQHEHATGPARSDAERSDGAVRAQRSKLFFGRVSGADPGHALVGGVCYCCKTALVAAAGGRVYAAWRHVYPGNVRDVAFSMSSDGGTTFAAPVRVSDDRWVLDGCPENGPALAVDARSRVHVVWPTLVPPEKSTDEPTLALFYAMSSDGRRFTARQRMPSGPVARHPQLALGSRGDLVAVWDEPAGGRRRVAMARGTVDANGVASFVRQTFDDRDSATYPVVAVTNEGPLVAWVSGSTGPTVIRVARVAP